MISIFLSFTIVAALVLTGLPGWIAGGGPSSLADVNTAYAATTGAAIATPVAISTAVVSQIQPIVYNGKSQKPVPVVTVENTTLTLNTDYTLSYKNNKLPGKATITINAKSPAYTGQKMVDFNIIIEAPTKPKARVTGDNLKQIVFSWGAVSGATGYKFFSASNKKFKKLKNRETLEGSNTTSYTIDHPYYARNYYYKIRAYRIIKDKTYYSAYTDVKLFKTKNRKWILVDLSKQKTYCKLGKKTKKTYTISSGKKETPTVQGTYYIYMKREIHTMIGYENGEKIYETPDVRWISYFIGGYAFHATYWHNNFGRPVSHGCVNMRTNEAKWLYKWAPMGTKVKVQP
ncbi:MAG: L,D-transpeptidase [Clostridiales Family XIII bacterium]|nr:L,D-transpeptidase [Clostridiales Family XIII bacterium]